MTFRDEVNAYCATLPGAEVSDPWGGGHDAWKVGGRMFACFGAIRTGLSVKTADPDFAAMLIEQGVAERAPYLHASWVCLPTETDPEEARHRVAVSYDLIRSRLTKKAPAALPPRTDLP